MTGTRKRNPRLSPPDLFFVSCLKKKKKKKKIRPFS